MCLLFCLIFGPGNGYVRKRLSNSLYIYYIFSRAYMYTCTVLHYIYYIFIKLVIFLFLPFPIA
nr:MAG TPA: hypothetical protein [Caudoviricetes sp.]